MNARFSPTSPRVHWLREHPSPEAPEFRLGREGDDLIAEWTGLGTLRANARGRDGVFSPAPGVTDREVVRTRQVADSLLRHLRGELAFHGSAVAFDANEQGTRAVAFLGESGAGKSTVAACVCARLSAALVADDLLHVDVVDGVALAMPTARAHRLLADAREALGLSTVQAGKADVSPKAHSTLPVPLVAIVLLAYDRTAHPVLEPLRGDRAFRALNDSLFRFVVDEPRVIRRDLDALADVCELVPTYALVRARGLEHLPAAASLVANLASHDHRGVA